VPRASLLQTPHVLVLEIQRFPSSTEGGMRRKGIYGRTSSGVRERKMHVISTEQFGPKSAHEIHQISERVLLRLRL
jgi:hypothetical protein